MGESFARLLYVNGSVRAATTAAPPAGYCIGSFVFARAVCAILRSRCVDALMGGISLIDANLAFITGEYGQLCFGFAHEPHDNGGIARAIHQFADEYDRTRVYSKCGGTHVRRLAPNLTKFVDALNGFYRDVLQPSAEVLFVPGRLIASKSAARRDRSSSNDLG